MKDYPLQLLLFLSSANELEKQQVCFFVTFAVLLKILYFSYDIWKCIENTKSNSRR